MTRIQLANASSLIMKATGAIVATIILVGGCAVPARLSDADKNALNNLDAIGVVRTYFSSGDRSIEVFLSGPKERKRRQLQNFIEDNDRVRGIKGLFLQEGKPEKMDVAGSRGWSELRQFIVKYSSPVTNNIGQPPGPRLYFVYVGRAPSTRYWKILSVGSGP